MSQMHFVVATENIKCHTFIMQVGLCYTIKFEMCLFVNVCRF